MYHHRGGGEGSSPTTILLLQNNSHCHAHGRHSSHMIERLHNHISLDIAHTALNEQLSPRNRPCIVINAHHPVLPGTLIPNAMGPVYRHPGRDSNCGLPAPQQRVLTTAPPRAPTECISAKGGWCSWMFYSVVGVLEGTPDLVGSHADLFCSFLIGIQTYCTHIHGVNY
jgi:hypothetical protein